MWLATCMNGSLVESHLAAAAMEMEEYKERWKEKEWPAAEMTDIRGGGGISSCNERCGCPYPCPGGAACRCETEGGREVHKRCSCGEHCGCNPCTCSNAAVGVGKANCRCGEACRCVSCST